MKLTIPADIESAISKQAELKHQVPEDLALDTLRERFMPNLQPDDPSASLADFLADHIGVVSSGELAGGGMSDKCGDSFTDALLAKRQQGHL